MPFRFVSGMTCLSIARTVELVLDKIWTILGQFMTLGGGGGLLGEYIHFFGYTIDVQKRCVLRAGEPLPVTNQGWEVLLFLAKRSGQVVSRDELMAAAWKNKLVSDATLHKQIQRLRQTLNADDEIIKTIHGQGFMFVPEVRFDANGSNPAQVVQHSPLKRLLLGMLLVLLVYLLMAAFDDSEHGVNLDAEATPVVLSIIPQVNELSPASNQWLGFGGMHYLNGRLGHNVPIQIKRLSKRDTSGANATEKAIELTRSEAVDVVLILDVNEAADQFSAQTELRNDAGVLNTARFDSLAMKDLMDQVQSWVNAELGVAADPETQTADPIFSENRYAVENFIRGMAAQHTGNAAQAITYFEQATAEDNRFWQAWYELAIAYRKQGLHEKSLAILKTIEMAQEASPLELRVQNATALSLWRLGRHAQALEAINQAIMLAEKTASPAINAFLTNKAIIAKEMGDLPTAEKAIARSIHVLNASDTPRDNALGSAHNTLAGINQANGDLTEAMHNAKLAVQYFNQAQDKRYEVVAKSRLASVLMDMGQLKAARDLIQQNLVDQESLQDVSGQISNHIKLARIDIAQGEFKALNARLITLLALSDGVENQFLANQVLAIQIEHRLLTEAYHHVDSLLNELADKTHQRGSTGDPLAFEFLAPVCNPTRATIHRLDGPCGQASGIEATSGDTVLARQAVET